jgi:hypothetical protein
LEFGASLDVGAWWLGAFIHNVPRQIKYTAAQIPPAFALT